MDDRATDRISRFLTALRDLGPAISEHRASFDRERRIPEVLFAKLADAGLFRLWLPGALGGPELTPFDFMQVVEAASALDGTIGWLIGNGGGMSRAGGYLPKAAARDLFADQRAFVTSSTATVCPIVPADGGFRVSGRWPFGSGAHHASWFMGLCQPPPRDGKEQPVLCCYFPRGSVTIYDTWHVSGLRATGSCEFEVSDLLVPAEHTHPFIDLTPTQPGSIYRMPRISAFTWTVATVPLGIARGAIGTFSELASRKTRAGTTATMRDRETVQSAVGRAESMHRAARALLVEAMQDLMVATDVGGDRLVQARGLFRAACSFATETAVRIVDMMATEAGAASIFESSHLERAVRDVHVTAKHVAMSPNHYILAGRLALGLEPVTGRF